MERLKSSSFFFFFASKTEASSSLPTHNQRSLTRSSSSIFQEQDMGKTILILAFSATIALVVLLFNLRSSVPQVDPPLSLRFLGMAILIAFSASFIAISLGRSFPRAATILEHIGIVSTVAAFFMLMSFLLPSHFKWLVLAACVVSLLGYVVPHVEGFSVSTDADADAGVEGG